MTDSNAAPLLVIDDDPDIREILQLLLEASGYRVVTACDGVDAREKLDPQAPPALILLDMMMPRMDGEQFLRELPARLRKRVPVVIMSGHGSSSEKMGEYPATGRLTKPIELDDLMDVVHRAVSD